MPDNALTDEHYAWVRNLTGIDVGPQADQGQPGPPADLRQDHPSQVIDTDRTASAAQNGSPTEPSHPTDKIADQPGPGDPEDADDPGQAAQPPVDPGSQGARAANVDDVADDTAAVRQVSEAADKVAKLSDEDLKKLPAADKVKMLKDLQAGGKPSGDARKAQMKVLRDMQLDPGFKKREDEHGDNIAKALKGDKDLKAARDNWAKLSADDKIKALDKIVAAQSKEYGIPPPKIEKEYKKPYTGPSGKQRIENGHFDPNDGKLYLNTHKDSKMSNFGAAIDLVIHENGHNYQQKLIKDLQDGNIKPGDPDYDQATIFAANDGAGGYIPPKEDPDTYVKQPKENHSRTIGPETSKKIIDTL